MRKLNIVCETAHGANLYLMKANLNALNELGHNAVFYSPEQKNPFDFFYEFENIHGPIDIFLGHAWRANRGLLKCLGSRPSIKISMRVNHFGDWDCDREKYPIEFASPQEIDTIKTLSAHPGFNNVTTYYPDQFVQEARTHNHWEKFDLKVTGIMPGVDTTDYYPVPQEEKYKRDIAYVGNMWPYKGVKLSSYIYPLLPPLTDHSAVLMGNSWRGPFCVGNAGEDIIRRFYSSSLICPNVHEPHSDFVHDCNQRLTQVPATMGFEVCAKVAGLPNYFEKDELFVVDSPKEMLEATNHFIKNPDERGPWIKKSYLKTYKCHQNFHRLATLASLLGEEELASQSLTKAAKIYEIREQQLGD